MIPTPAWPRRTARLLLRQPNDSDIAQVLRWRNAPELGRWLLSTTVDPQAYRRAWRAASDDPDDHGFVALVGDRVIGTCTLDIRDAMGQPAARGEPWRGAEAPIGYLLLDPRVYRAGIWHRDGASHARDRLRRRRSAPSHGVLLRRQHRLMAGHGEGRDALRAVRSAGLVARRARLGRRLHVRDLRSEWEGSEGQRVAAGWGSRRSAEV